MEIHQSCAVGNKRRVVESHRKSVLSSSESAEANFSSKCVKLTRKFERQLSRRRRTTRQLSVRTDRGVHKFYRAPFNYMYVL